MVAQGNQFIRELLRDKGLRISGTKGQFATRLEEAVDSGALTFDDVEAWLRRVEGWGNFHIYPFRVPDMLVRSRRWRPAEVRHRLSDVSEDLWDASTSHVFPEVLSLGHVSFRDRTLRLTWHQGSSWRQRSSDHDRVEDIDGDRFEFDAYLIRRERTVVRLQISLDQGLGAVFVPYPRTDANHRAALSGVWETVAGLVTPEDLPAFDVSGIIRAADQAQLDGTGALRSRSSRLTVQDGYVEFGSTIDAPYGDIDPLRQVRLAAGPDAFAGNRATFFYSPADDPQGRHLTVTLSGPGARVWLPAQLQEPQVWALVTALGRFAA
ncbi:MAG: hypothetical protein LC808_00210 [Actinobacteria bacterium]|nr:hypothetical protein [Actinomycetota bacterium]